MNTEIIVRKDNGALVERGGRAKWWRRCGSRRRGFFYLDSKGQPITDAKRLERIRALVIPPAWEEVRIAPSPRSPLQVVGIDTSGRIQYRYHPDFVADRQQKKYSKIERFGKVLPCLRRITNEHIHLEGLSRERVLAVVVRLINDLYFRVGTEASVQRYKTYGVTTLRNKHLEIKPGGRLFFKFIGKDHVPQRCVLVDAELAELIGQIKALGGAKLFQYLDADGKPHPITPHDVNTYIKAATGPEFSAKDFRTWGGTLLAAIELAEMGKPETEKQAKRNIVLAAKRTAERLGNTPTVCRDCYIHPIVFERYREGVTLTDFRRKAERIIRKRTPEYELEEIELLKLFDREGDAR